MRERRRIGRIVCRFMQSPSDPECTIGSPSHARFFSVGSGRATSVPLLGVVRVWQDRQVDSPGAPSDAELVARVLAGEEDLYGVLVDRYKLRLFRFVSRYLGDPEDARDVTQEVFVKVYGALDSFDPRYRFSTWLFRIAGNAAIDHLRRRRIRAVPLELPADEEAEGRSIDPADARPDPLEDLSRARLREASTRRSSASPTTTAS